MVDHLDVKLFDELPRDGEVPMAKELGASATLFS